MLEQFMTPGGYTCGEMVKQEDGTVLVFSGETRACFDGARELWRTAFHPPVELMAISRLQDGRLIGLSYDDPKPAEVTAAGLNGSTFSLWYSKDSGESWEGPQALCTNPGCYYVHNGRILQLSSGRILIPANWVPPQAYGKGIETSDLAGAFYSDDNGATWKESNWIAASTPGDHLAESIAVELPGGQVKCFMRSTSGYMRQALSRDGGITWEPETATSLRMPCSPFTVAKDPYTQDYYAVWIHSFPAPVYQFPRSPLSLAVSHDNTASWEFLGDLECNPNCNYGYPVMAFQENHLLFLYYVNEQSRSFSYEQNRLKLKIIERASLPLK